MDRTTRGARAFDLRSGSAGDEALVLGLLDDAVAWLGARGITAQWGTAPFSSLPARVEQARDWASSGGLVLARAGDELCGALVLGDAPAYAPPTDRPEVYVVLLVASRRPAARGVGAVLLDHARTVAQDRGVERVRLDCFAGGDQSLVRFYEAKGFSRLGTFEVGTWPGQVLACAVPPAP